MKLTEMTVEDLFESRRSRMADAIFYHGFAIIALGFLIWIIA